MADTVIDTGVRSIMAPKSKAEAMALVAEAEAEAAEAEALAAAARARARAARLRREALALGDTVEDADEPAGRRSRMASMPKASMFAKAAAIILILGFAGASGYLVWKQQDATRQQQRTAAFVAGAKQGVINLTSLNFDRAKEDVQRVIDSSTGEFRDQFQQRAADFTRVVQESKAITEGTVNAAAVESMGEHSAKVLVCATSRVTNKPDAKDEPRTWRLKVTMADDGGQYKMSKVEFVP
jgi:Mce-associated membrane protein